MKNIFRGTTAIIAVTISVFFLFTQSASAQNDFDMLSFAVGYYDVFDNDGAVDLRVEYRPHSPIFIDQLRPWVGLEVTSDATIWAGGGLLLDLQVYDNIYFTPSIGVGLYAHGSSDVDLGHPIEFRSQLEVAYQFETNQRLGLALSHTSNAGLDDENCGTEVLSLYWHMPF